MLRHFRALFNTTTAKSGMENRVKPKALSYVDEVWRIRRDNRHRDWWCCERDNRGELETGMTFYAGHFVKGKLR